MVGLGYELVDLEQSPRGKLLRVFIDRNDRPRGVDIDDCVAVSNQLSRVLMVENIDYDRLEVSSPGLDRPLKKLSDFERFAGAQAHVKTRLPVSGRRNFVGTLKGLNGEAIRLECDGAELELELSNVDRARLVPQFD